MHSDILKSGADYAYIMVALGRFPAFIRYCHLPRLDPTRLISGCGWSASSSCRQPLPSLPSPSPSTLSSPSSPSAAPLTRLSSCWPSSASPSLPLSTAGMSSGPPRSRHRIHLCLKLLKSGSLHLRKTLCAFCHHRHWDCAAVQGEGGD